MAKFKRPGGVAISDDKWEKLQALIKAAKVWRKERHWKEHMYPVEASELIKAVDDLPVELD